MIKNSTKLLKRNFTYLNTKLSQNNKKITAEENTLNYFLIENDDQIQQLPNNKLYESSKSLKKIQNYPNFTEKTKS